MKVLIPFSFLPPKFLESKYTLFFGLAEKVEPYFPLLKIELRQAEMDISSKKYLAMCFLADTFTISMLFVLSMIFISKYSLSKAFLFAPLITICIGGFILLQQFYYPKLKLKKKIKNLEQNLMPALQSFLIQLNSGVPIFNILVNLAENNYGEVSTEFRKAIKEINAGQPQVDVLDELASENPSILFRRGIWQIANGMKAGSNMSTVMSEIIDALGEEQLIQIQNYGSQLNPLAMFYMLAAVIVPALSITFIIIISSFIDIGEAAIKAVFWVLLGAVLFMQFMFMGIIKSKRPNLMTS